MVITVHHTWNLLFINSAHAAGHMCVSFKMHTFSGGGVGFMGGRIIFAFQSVWHYFLVKDIFTVFSKILVVLHCYL